MEAKKKLLALHQIYIIWYTGSGGGGGARDGGGPAAKKSIQTARLSVDEPEGKRKKVP